MIISYPSEWNNHEVLLDIGDFALQEQPEDNLMVAFSQAIYRSQSNPWNCIIQ